MPAPTINVSLHVKADTRVAVGECLGFPKINIGENSGPDVTIFFEDESKLAKLRSAIDLYLTRLRVPA